MSASVQSGAPQPSSEQSLQGSAATAALYVTRDTHSSNASHPLLDEDGRLSAASAATSLKYARAQDLPSFPSQGGVKLASASAAASLANDNQKPFEHWKPDAIPAANKAAMQAKDYKMNPLWQPELSAAGSKAALQAHGSSTSPSIWRASESEHGLSAAAQAHQARKSPNAITNRDVPASDHRKALLAATGAMAGSRRRSGSAPIQPPAQPAANASAGWALKAATSTHKPANARGDFASGDPGFEAARIQNIAKNNVNRQMYGSAPPVAIEVEEKNRQDTLRASAVAMAQKMYAIQQSHIDDARGVSDSTSGARAARNRASSDVSSTSGAQPPGRGYENLQEAATRLAQEKLAKLNDEHAEYRQYYGQTTPQGRSRLSMRHRRTTSNTNEDDDSDEEQSRKIRSQMSLFQNKLAEVDTKKRQADRDALLQAAHKNVTSQLNKMDERIFSETGKSSPQQRELWERQARERAQRESDERMVNVGRVHVGGGKYLDQAEIDAIAKSRLQPTLDEITDKAEKQRARDEEIRLEQERVRQEQETEKQRQAEIKRELKEQQNREKMEERARRNEEKRTQKEEAAAEKEKARAEREEKRKSQGKRGGFFSGIVGGGRGAGDVATAGAVGAGTGIAAGAAGTSAAAMSSSPGAAEAHEATTTEERMADADVDQQPELERHVTTETMEEAAGSSRVASPIPATQPIAASSPATPAEEPATSPSKRDSRMMGWFRGRFGSKSQHDSEPVSQAAVNTTEESTSAAKKSIDTDDNEGDLPRSDSMRDVALAGRQTRESDDTEDMYGVAAEEQPKASEDVTPVSPVKETPPSAERTRDRSPSISSLSSSDGEAEPATGSAATGVALPAITAHTATTEPTAKNSIEGTRTLDSEESRGRKGFRQRLLKKVKPSSSYNSTPTAAPTTSTQSEQPAKTTSSFGGGLMSSKLKKSSNKDKDKSASTAAVTTPTATEDEATATADTGKRSQDTAEREEARDTFAEESLAPPPKIGSEIGDAARPSSPKGGSREGSRFREEL